jgi:hypothetical protein
MWFVPPNVPLSTTSQRDRERAMARRAPVSAKPLATDNGNRLEVRHAHGDYARPEEDPGHARIHRARTALDFPEIKIDSLKRHSTALATKPRSPGATARTCRRRSRLGFARYSPIAGTLSRGNLMVPIEGEGEAARTDSAPMSNHRLPTR